MNLETLLEAAKYVEYSSKAKARGEEPHDYDTFGRLYSREEASLPGSRHNRSASCRPEGEPAACRTDTSKERRRSGGGQPSREAAVLGDEVQGGGGTREVHNKLEKNRRAHLKECFETLKRQLPNMEERKTSNLSILRGALRYIQSLKRKEREYEHEMERLAREKIAAQQKLAALRKELSSQLDHIDVISLLPDDDNETTTTASECGGMQLSDVDDEDDAQIDISSVSRYHNSSSSDITSPASSVSNTATSDSMTGTMTVTSIAADDSIVASKSINTSLISEVLSTVSSSVVSTTSISSALTHSTVSTTDSVPHSLPKMQPSMTTTSLASANSLLHNTSSGNQSSPAHASLPSQVTTACSFQVAGMLTNPHTNTIQVITQPGGVKVIAAPNPLGNNTSVGHSTSTPTVQNGPLHILTSTASLMAIGAQNATGTSSVVTSSPKTTGTQSLVRVAPISGVNSAKQLMPPLTLVASQAVMGVTQVTTATKSIIINQVAGLTGLATSSAGTTESSNSGIVKSLAITSSAAVTTTTMLTAKGSNQTGNVLTSVTAAVPSQPNAITALQTTKSLSHIVQSGMTGRSIATPQILPTAVPASQINSVGRHIVAASIKSVSPAARSSLSQLSGVAHVTHVMPQSPVAASVSHIVSAGSHVSAVTPLVTPMSMVSHSATVHHPQVYSAQPQLGKVITSPVLKSVGQIPIIPQQFLQPAVGSVAAQPVVVVSMAAASNGPPTSAATSSANKQLGAINVPVTQ